MSELATLLVNGRSYQLPSRLCVAICLDGSADAYLDAALSRGLMPNLRAMVQKGWRGRAISALPSFTNVNNVSIVTGVPPGVHGINGNFFLDRSTGQETMMNSGKYLRAETILAEASRAGRRVAMVTAKEKLRDLLSVGMKGIAFSSEKANQTTLETHGVADAEELVGQKTPPIYSAEASLFVLDAGVRLLESGQSDFIYLSLTDYVQHKHGPEEPAALDFYGKIDQRLGRLVATGALVAATADHGMNDKQTAAGAPQVTYLESELHGRFPGCRVILPITDPYVKHHGALGSFAEVYLPAEHSPARVKTFVSALPGVTEVYLRDEAVVELELPGDRTGDLVVLSGRDVVLGRTPEHHDLSVLEGRLRSHGGRFEQEVPLLLSHPLSATGKRKAEGKLRNFDLFDLLLNGVDAGS